MAAAMQKFKQAFFGYKEIPFFYSVWYNLVLSVFVYIVWFFDVGVYGIVTLMVLGSVVLALCRDLTPIVPYAFLVPLTLSKVYSAAGSWYLFVAGFCLMVAGATIHIVRFRPLKNFGKIKGFVFAAAIAGLAIALGGIAMKGRAPLPALFVAALGIVMGAAPFFLSGTMGRDDADRLVKCVMRALMSASLIALVQMITVLARSGDVVATIASKYDIDTGWGQPNTLANVMMRSVPVAIYWSLSKKKGAYLWLMVAYVLAVFSVLTSSRSAILVGGILSLICIIYYFPKAEDKFAWGCMLAMLVGITCIGLGVVGGDRIKKLFATLERLGTDSNGRFALYRRGLERFKLEPVFGVGFDYDLGGRTEDYHTTDLTPYWYHNTLIQIVTCMGVFGAVVFAFYFYWQYRSMFRSKNKGVRALIFTLIFMQGVSMLDIFFFTPQDYLIMMMITIAAVKTLPADKDNSHLIYDLPALFKGKKQRKGEESK